MDSENRAQQGRGEPIRALVVDDNPDIAHLMAELLGKITDVDVVAIAIGGEPGLELATTYQVDLVLTDMDMPGTSGLRLASLLRKRLPKICIIVTSGHDDSWAKPAVAAGADSFISKCHLVEKLPEEIARLRKKGVLHTRTKGQKGDHELHDCVGERLPHPRQ